MRQTLLDSATKEALRTTVRGLHDRLIGAFVEQVKSEYHLDVPAAKAQLPEAKSTYRRRLEEWLDEQCRATRAKKATKKGKPGQDTLRARYLEQAAKEAAYTLLNRLVFVRILEHHGKVSPPLVTGGWKSHAYADEFALSAEALLSDDTRGYQAILELLFAELALDLPGLFGPVGLTQVFPIPAATLREVVELLNGPELDAAWGDDTTLGWVYQFWNDPEREAIDLRITDGGKIEPHELAAKTQMYTERYMVEWLLHNSLGQIWLAICKKHGWTPDFDQVREPLEQRRAEWRKRREAGDVKLDALMPIHGPLEERWKDWVPQPLLPESVTAAPERLRDLKLLDPACGSGHFLVVAFDLLAALYEEEARHRGEEWAAEKIAASIIENNLHGIDIDTRAVQLAAANLWLKAVLYSSSGEQRVRFKKVNLIAPSFRFAGLPQGDVAFECLCSGLQKLDVPREVTLRLVRDLQDVEHFGTLLRVEGELHSLLQHIEQQLGPPASRGANARQSAIQAHIADFLEQHAARADLGLKLDGEQVSAGLRFVDLVADGRYDLVVGNPPYQITSKLWDSTWFRKNYPKAKADLYACFIERALQLAKPGGLSALLTMRSWLFLGQYQELREKTLRENYLALLGDVDRGAFEDIPDEVVSTSMSIVVRLQSRSRPSIAIQPTPLDDRSRDSGRTARKRAALLAQVGRCEFKPTALSVIEGTPVVYWWNEELIRSYAQAKKVRDVGVVRKGLCTGNNVRFNRLCWEVAAAAVPQVRVQSNDEIAPATWLPTVLGAKGQRWIEPLHDIVRWASQGLEIRLLAETSTAAVVPSRSLYMTPGVSFAAIGSEFSARKHRYRSIFGDKAPTVFHMNANDAVTLLNATTSKQIISSLNPSISYQAGDVVRLPVLVPDCANDQMAVVEQAFDQHESQREPSVEFKSPGPSCWREAQSWAQLAVDRRKGAPLPPYKPVYCPPDPTAYVSFAVGIALGRFGANGEGIQSEAPKSALPAGILYISPSETLADSFSHLAAAPLVGAWTEHSPAILKGKSQELRDWLRKDFFAYHKNLYENRPIYLPLSSRERNFVAFVSIHRWVDNTLQVLLSSHLKKNLSQLNGEIADINRARASSNKQSSSNAEKQYARTKKLRDELADFIDAVTQCAHRGAPPIDAKCPEREIDATFHMDLDDGVMINSAALWPLLEPQWKDPKKWWRELCRAEGRKDYDWAHLAQRYFPDRVDRKCQEDPSLSVAHGRLWTYHPARAYRWELRLKDEIGENFAIDEGDAAKHRKRFLVEHAEEAAQLLQEELRRRERAAQRQEGNEDTTTEPENDVEPLEADDEAASSPSLSKAGGKRASAPKKRASSR